jgi:MFS family permease
MLAGNALMFSSRFLLMSIGAAAGGVATDLLGYKAAFILNALAFVISAICISRVPERAMQSEAEQRAGLIAREDSDAGQIANREATAGGAGRVWSDLREGWAYILSNRLVAAVLGVNIMWALGGGALNLIYDRLGGVYFAAREGWSGDAGVAIFYVAAGAGMFTGMLAVRRLGAHVELRGRVPQFLGWALMLHGVIFALTGLMPTLWLAALMVFLSRIVIAVEFAIQETLVMRLLPNNLRGRVFTTDRAAEIGMMSLSTGIAGASLNVISVGTLAVLSGLLAGLPGAIWLWLFASGKLSLPPSLKAEGANPEVEQGAVATA